MRQHNKSSEVKVALLAVAMRWQFKLVYSRDQSLLDVAPHLFTSHYYYQLGGQLDQTATRVTLLRNKQRYLKHKVKL